MKLSSPAFVHGSAIPRKYSCDGDNVSPPLTIEGVPDGTATLVLIMDDPDAPGGTWVHWLMWNIERRTTQLAEGAKPLETNQGTNSWGKVGYGGPCPPSGTHHYVFRLFALNDYITLGHTATRKDIDRVMQGKILDRCELVGTYRRQLS